MHLELGKCCLYCHSLMVCPQIHWPECHRKAAREHSPNLYAPEESVCKLRFRIPQLDGVVIRHWLTCHRKAAQEHSHLYVPEESVCKPQSSDPTA